MMAGRAAHVSTEIEMAGIQSISEHSLSNASELGTVIAHGPTKSSISEGMRLRKLHRAAQGGNNQVLSHLLDIPGLDVNAKDEMGLSALMLAAWKGHTECVRLLLCKGADVLIATRDNFTCLHMAAFCGHIEVVNLLLHGKSPRQCFDKWDPKIPSSWDRRALMDQKSYSESFTALHMAAIGVHHQGVAIAASLLEAYRTSVLEIYGLAWNPKVDYGIDDELWLDYLLQIRNILNLEDGDSSSEAILQSVESYANQSESVFHDESLDKYQGLMRSYAELVSYSNARDKIGRTALHYAAWKKKSDVVQFLTWDTKLGGPQGSQLGSVANVNATDVDGYTPLHLASRNGSTDVVIALLKLDGVVKDENLSPRQALLQKKIYLQPNPAARPNLHSPIIAKEILASLHDLDQGQNDWDLESFAWAESRAGVTPLHYAVEKGHTKIVKLLVEHPKIDVFQCTSNGQSPWTIAFPSHINRSQLGVGATESRLLLRSGKHPPYRQKLLKKAADLAVVVDREGDADIDAGSQFLVLEIQILTTFLETITGRRGPRGKLTSNCDKRLRFQVIDEVKKENRDINCSWEQAMERYSHRTSINMERISLLHVAAFEGCDEELEKLLPLKKYKKCINDRENITRSGYTALHFATMTGKTDTRPLTVLLNEPTLDPTMRNKKRQTALHVVEHELRSERSKSLLESKQLLMRHPDVKQSLERLYIDRQVYANAANALLVGAALVASISFAGWIQPPALVGDQFDEQYKASYQSRASTRFGISFLSALATMLTGAAAALPSGHFIEKEVAMGRRWLIVTSAFFVFSIFCILVSFLDIPTFAITFLSGVIVIVLTVAGFFYRLCTTRTVPSRIVSYLSMLGICILTGGFCIATVVLILFSTQW